ncbi:MAG: hypothetical protein NVS2B4_01930 [Ramlibacter sp.]
MAAKPPTFPVRPSFSGDRATAPGALEETGESAWQRFEEIRAKEDRHFAPTEPGQRTPGTTSRAFQATQPMTLQPGESARPTARARAPLSLDDVMLVARKNNRACPMPASWQALHGVLAALTPPGGRPLPTLVDGPAWDVVSPMQKRLRLRDQIEWAESAGALDAVHRFLLALGEEQWLHF